MWLRPYKRGPASGIYVCRHFVQLVIRPGRNLHRHVQQRDHWLKAQSPVSQSPVSQYPVSESPVSVSTHSKVWLSQCSSSVGSRIHDAAITDCHGPGARVRGASLSRPSSACTCDRSTFSCWCHPRTCFRPSDRISLLSYSTVKIGIDLANGFFCKKLPTLGSDGGDIVVPFDTHPCHPIGSIKVNKTGVSRCQSWPKSQRNVGADDYSSSRCLSSTGVRRYDTSNVTTEGEPYDLSTMLPTPITHFSDTEQAMAEAVSKFAEEQLRPKVREMDENETMDPEIVEQLFEQGLMGVEIPEKYGGAGMNFTSAIVGIEELAKVDPSVSVLADVHNTLVNTAILKYGTEESRKKWLPKLATSVVGSFCLSEPASGSDAFALKTRAEKTADGYRINGSKMWITNSMEAGFFIVFANLNPEKGYKGITAFLVDKDTKGFSIAKKEKKLGIRASSTCVLNFDDVEIPHENLLGQEGHGYKYAIGILNEGRIGIAAQMTGLALGAFENAAKYVWNDRKQFGQLVGEFQGMQHQLAQAYTEICAARALVYNAARKKEAGEDFVMDAAMAKLYSSQVAGRVSCQAVEWMGGMGFVREGLAEKYYRDSLIGKIYEGSSNIQLSTVAKLLQRQYTV